MPVTILMSGPIRPSESAVLDVLATLRRQLPDARIVLCTWTGQATPRIRDAVSMLLEVDEPTGDVIDRSMPTRTRQTRELNLPAEWSWNMFRMLYGVQELVRHVSPSLSDDATVMRVRTDLHIEFAPGYLDALLAQQPCYLARSGDGFDWMCIAPFRAFREAWTFSSLEELNRCVAAAWNAESLIRDRVRIPIHGYDKSRVDDGLYRATGLQRFK